MNKDRKTDEGQAAEDNSQSNIQNDEEIKVNESVDEKENVINDELESLKVQLEEKSRKSDEYMNLLQRTAAEFDNFRKRTAREKEALYSDAVSDVVLAMLPGIDNLERAMSSSSEDSKSLREGLEMVLRQFKDSLKKLGVEEIKCIGQEFNPELHNAVLHIEDESVDGNVIVDELQKGYVLNDKVIRHSMVKVAN